MALPSAPDAQRLVIVGGGFAGAALAIHAVPASNRLLDIPVQEPRAELGRGVAHSTTDPSHRINGPARNPLVAGLLAAGTVRRDAAGFGLAVDRGSRVLDVAGHANPASTPSAR